jgi:hypothetical protein
MVNTSPPVYEQIAEVIRRQIHDGDYLVGDKLPSENELCEIHKVARGTIRRAINGLIAEGLLESEKGKGTFVTSPESKTLLWNFGSLTDRLNDTSERALAKVLEQTVVIRGNRKMLRLKRLRSIETENTVIPISLDISFLPVDLLPGIEKYDFEDESIYRILRQKYNRKPTQSLVSLKARIADQGTKRILKELPSTRCLLHATGATYDNVHVCIEESEITYSSRVQAVMHIDHHNGYTKPLQMTKELHHVHE